MDRSAFGAVSYDFSDPTVKGAKDLSATADEYSGGAAQAYLKSAFAGVMVPLDPKILQIQADMARRAYIQDLDTLAKVQADDPGGPWNAEASAMQDFYQGDGAGAYTTQPTGGFFDQYKMYVIAGAVLAGGLGLIWYLRK